MTKATVTLSKDRTVVSNREISRRGLNLVCRNLAGQYVYSATDAAWQWVKQSCSCEYINDNDQRVAVTA